MSDNSAQNGTDPIRDIDRSGAGPKTMVVQLDHGGAGATESLTSAANPLPTYDASENKALFRGRATTFRAVGRAGTTPRRLITIWNPAASGRIIHINQFAVDLSQTAAMLVTVVPPVVRIYRVTAAPTNGTVLTKVAKDTALSSGATIELRGDASADGTNSASALAATTTAGSAITQEFAARLITAAGYEPFDREEFLVGYDVVVRPGEGLCLSLDVTLATQDPATSNWIVGIDWYEV